MPNTEAPGSAAQQREGTDPTEQTKPMSFIAIVVSFVMVLWGLGYILSVDSFGPAVLGDQRTIADLRGGSPPKAGQLVDGKQVYSAQCVACHQATGLGLPSVFPPLDGSEWVTGDERTLANILLHGITGQITVKGTAFTGAMPAFAQLSDEELAAVASHVRSTWSNKAPPLSAELFARERKASTRTTPFAGGDELKALGAKKTP